MVTKKQAIQARREFKAHQNNVWLFFQKQDQYLSLFTHRWRFNLSNHRWGLEEPRRTSSPLLADCSRRGKVINRRTKVINRLRHLFLRCDDCDQYLDDLVEYFDDLVELLIKCPIDLDDLAREAFKSSRVEYSISCQ